MAAPSTPAASGGTSPAFHPGELSCADAYTDDPLNVDSIPFTAGVGFEALSEAGFDPIPAERTGLPRDASGYFLKSPVYLDKGVTWAEVTALKGEVTFVWVPARVWTGPPGWSVATYQSVTARFEACEGSYTGFLGAVRTPTARECVTLGIRSNVHPEVESHRIAIGTGACG